MNAYYNEYDPKAAVWLRKLIKAGQIAPGFVDERSITEVDPEYVKLFTQAHFFAGIGGWSYALRLAGWADDRPCWTGSPPCQPFSNAGKQKAQADARHLWPVFFNLIRECKPPAIFGEQVEAAIRTGWLDDLQDDLEAENYATGKIVLPACGFGGYHIRQRIWFVAERVADTNDTRPQRHGRLEQQHDAQGRQKQAGLCAEGGELNRLADSEGGRQRNGLEEARGNDGDQGQYRASGSISVLADPNGEQNNTTDPRGLHAESCSEGRDGRLANTTGDRCQRQGQRWPAEEGREPRPESAGELSQGFERPSDDSPANAPESIWRNPDWLYCRDGKWRPVEPSVFGVANGLPNELVRSCNIIPACNPLAKDQEARTMRLKGYGNAIVPPLAAEFIKAYLSIDFGNA